MLTILNLVTSGALEITITYVIVVQNVDFFCQIMAGKKGKVIPCITIFSLPEMRYNFQQNFWQKKTRQMAVSTAGRVFLGRHVQTGT